MTNHLRHAPELQVSRWFNTERNLKLEDLRGKLTIIHAFQMLCPGCVTHALPQMLRLHQTFSSDEVNLIGLHTVFEHHAAMNPEALAAFIYEYQLPFPIGVDAPHPNHRIPQTMQELGLQGTPSLVILDRENRIRGHQFGRLDDLSLGLIIGRLLAEEGYQEESERGRQQEESSHKGCDTDACPA